MVSNSLPLLEQVDPAWAWQPWEPNDHDPWDRKWDATGLRLGALPAT